MHLKSLPMANYHRFPTKNFKFLGKITMANIQILPEKSALKSTNIFNISGKYRDKPAFFT